MAENPNAIKGVQANETFMLTGLDGAALGKGGETVGFAKYQFDEQAMRTSSAKSVRLYGVAEKMKGAAGTLTAALAKAGEGNENAEEVQTAMAAAVKELRRGLPEAERDGVNGMNPQQVVAAIQAAVPVLEAQASEASEVAEALNKVDLAAVDLFNPGHDIPADRGLLARSVASSQVDQLLGTNILAEETFGVTREGDVIGVSIQADGAGITGTHRFEEGAEKKDYILSVDLKNPTLQRGLADLEALDYLTGQIDRHCGNMFVDQNHKVTGIDNDLAFPERTREETIQAMPKGMRTKLVEKMPQHMHQETAEKILALDPETLRQTLKNIPTPDKASKLSDAAIESTCGRLVQMQKELKQPGGAIKVVSEFNDDTYNSAMAAQQVLAEAKLGNKIEDTALENRISLDDVMKSSYLGAVAVQTKRYELNAQVVQGDFLDRSPKTVLPAPRNAEAASYAQQMEMAKKTLMNNPASLAQMGPGMQQAEAIHKEIGVLKNKVAHYEKEQAGLQKNKIGSLVRSLASGGSAKRQEFYGEKKLEAMQQIGQLQRQLETIATNAISNEFKGDVRAFAQARAPQNQRAAVQPNPALAGMVPPHPAPPPPGQFNHAPPPDMAPAVPDQDNLVQGNDAPKAGKINIAAKSKEGDLTVKAAEDEQDIHDLDDDDDLGVNSEAEIEAEVKVEVKQESLKKSPSVAEMLKGANSAPALGGHRPEQAQGQDGPKPKTNTLRTSGEWQAAKPSAPKLGGGHSASHP